MWKIHIDPRISSSALNMAAGTCLVAWVDKSGCFMADVTKENSFRDQRTAGTDVPDQNEQRRPNESTALSVDVGEKLLKARPVPKGPACLRSQHH